MATEAFTNKQLSESHGKRAWSQVTRPAIVFVLLAAVYLLSNWIPLEQGSGTPAIGLGFLLFWVVGGAVTLAFLALSGRKG